MSLRFIKRESVDSLLLNLIKAQSDPTVQKVTAISDEKRLNIIRGRLQACHNCLID